jgi:hypothetical protein
MYYGHTAVIEMTALLFALPLSNNQRSHLTNRIQYIPSHPLNTMFTSKQSSYVPVPSDPTRPSDPDQSLLDVVQRKQSALSLDNMSWISKMWSLRSNKARERLNDLHTLATAYGGLSNLVSFAMGPPRIPSATEHGSLYVMHGIVNRINELRRTFVPGTMVHRDVEAGISLFDICRARAFRAEVRHLLPEKQQEEGITMCLDKARVFCTKSLGGACRHWPL